MKTNLIARLFSLFALCILGINIAMAGAGGNGNGSPVWTFTALTPTTVAVPSNSTTTVQHRVTNQSNKPHVLSLQSHPAITQLTTGVGICGNPAVLTGKASCILSLQINGSALTSPINSGPTLCEAGSTLQCYQPSLADILHATQAPARRRQVVRMVSDFKR